MAWYVANHHIGTKWGRAVPGEVFEADYTPEKEKRLVDMGAVTKLNEGDFAPETAAALGLEVLDDEAAEFEALSANAMPQEPQTQEQEKEDDAPIEIDPCESVKPKKGRKKK